MVAATQAREGLGEDLGPLSLATALVPERILQRSTNSSRGRCWSGTFKSTRINRGGSDDGTGARAYSHWARGSRDRAAFQRLPLAALAAEFNGRAGKQRRLQGRRGVEK